MRTLDVSFMRRNYTAFMPTALSFRVVEFTKAAIGGCKSASIIASGSANALWGLGDYIQTPVTIWRGGDPVWWGYVESITDIDATTGTAQLKCAGWWKSLSWRYYTNTVGMLVAGDSAGSRQNFSEGSGIAGVWQSFDWTTAQPDLTRVGLYIYETGVRTDNLTITIKADSGGNPTGATLATATITGSEVQPQAPYIEKALSVPVAGSASTRWIGISAVGAANATNYYMVGHGANTYGNFKVEVPASTFVYASDKTMNIKLLGTFPTTTQIATAINDTADVIDYVDIIDASGISTSPYRDSPVRLDEFVTDLLDQATTTSTRLLATVTVDRRLQIYTRPDATLFYSISGGARYGISMDNFANKLKIRYTSSEGGGSTVGRSTETNWITDADSIEEFYTHEIIITGNDMNSTSADYMAASMLSQSKYPRVTCDWSNADRQKLMGLYNNPIPLSDCPVGVWMKLVDVGAGAPSSARYANTSLVFVEEATYDAERDIYIPVPLGQPSPFEIPTVRRG